MEAPICALVDAMFRLPAKLDRLLARHGHMLPRGADDEIPLIKQDLERMISIFQEHVDSGVDDRAMMVNCLIKEVRELSYDMEDSVDQYEHAADTSRWILSPRRKTYKITRRRGKITRRLPENLKWRLWMANKIREFSVRSQEVLQRYSLFNHPGGSDISSTASTSTRCAPFFGSWHPTPYGELVGISAPLKKLEAWLDMDGEQRLKVVSVVGPGGVGKTTLANELYHRIGGQFECRAFVRSSRKPDVRRLLVSMLSQVRPHQTPDTWKVHSLISDIRTHLQDKRYLIVIDDIWDTQTWDIISYALPDGNLCSGLLITTEVEHVSLKCCGFDSKYVFTMKSLCHDDSGKLFFNTAFGPKYQCPPELSEVANKLIRKCAGLPLAAVTVANLLVRWVGKPEQWDYVNKSLSYGLRTKPTSEGMKQVLNLSYNNLPQHLKACVMYLSIYQEDDIIQKDDLVRQWIAEGFIPITKDKDSEEISRSYFDELISRRMIQPVHINDNDDVLSCVVHYMVLDFVRHKSIEENFVTAIDHCQTTASLADKVRRLSLHFGNAEATPPTNMRLSQVRTLAVFGVLKCLPSIVDFGLLQVLSLYLWGDDDDESINFDLTRISELFRLKYLHVKCNVTLNVQQIQMRALQCLETLKIDARVISVPSDIVHLPGLLHLSLPIETNLPNGIGHMTSLCTLRYFDLSLNSTENMQSLGELTNLRDLQLTCSTMLSSYFMRKMDNIGSILTKLKNLRSLTLEPSSILDSALSSMSLSCDGLSSVSSPPVLLRRFEWFPRICTFSWLPKWIGHLSKLCILKIGVRKLTNNDFDVLRGLPVLTVLSLYVRTKPAKSIVFNKTGFLVLKYFKFKCCVPWLEFEVDTMPNLVKLKLGFDAHGVQQDGTIPVGIMHLTGLKEFSAKIGCAGASDPDRRAAESALINAIKMHPACPTFNIRRLDGNISGKDDNTCGVQEQEYMTQQKQYEITEDDSIEQHGVIRKGTREDAQSRFSAFSEWRTVADKQADRRKALPRWSTQVRMSSMRHGDGFLWMKYGQKNMLGSKHPRAYYRCTHWNTQGCPAVKNLQRTDDDPELFDAMYEGNHTCTLGVSSQPQPEQEQSSVSMGVKVKRIEKRRPRELRSIQVLNPHTDGVNWRKYGQKELLGCLRSYYRCVSKDDKGCNATKSVQQSDSDRQFFDVVYYGEHTCGASAHSPTEIDHSLLHHTSISAGLMPPATSKNLISLEAVSSSSAAGIRFRSPATSAGSQVTHEGVSRSTTGVQYISPGASETERQVTYEEASGSTAEFWSVPTWVDLMTNSPEDGMLDPNADFVDETGFSE